MIDPVIYWVVLLSLAVLWGTAAAGKWRDGVRFRQVLSAYRLLPAVVEAPVAAALPLLEVVIATGLLLPATRDYSAVTSAAVLLLYMTAMALNLARGRIHIDCGCGLGTRQTIGWSLVARNGFLAMLSLLLLLPQTGRETGVPDSLVALLATAFVCLVWPLAQLAIKYHIALLNGVD